MRIGVTLPFWMATTASALLMVRSPPGPSTIQDDEMNQHDEDYSPGQLPQAASASASATSSSQEQQEHSNSMLEQSDHTTSSSHDGTVRSFVPISSRMLDHTDASPTSSSQEQQLHLNSMLDHTTVVSSCIPEDESFYWERQETSGSGGPPEAFSQVLSVESFSSLIMNQGDVDAVLTPGGSGSGVSSGGRGYIHDDE
ncbi:unnamed protein product, partial [Amoebophrya sp. A25]|eukprot:GSA25T00019958001.1